MDTRVRFIITLLFIFTSFSAFAYEKAPMYVSVKEAKVTEKTSTLSKKIGTLPYGTAVLIDKRQKGWCYVVCQARKVSGWLPENVLTKKNILSRGKGTTANAKEIALAGKGFSAAIEAEYAKSENVDFSNVDLVETYSISSEDIVSFIEQGLLNKKDEE